MEFSEVIAKWQAKIEVSEQPETDEPHPDASVNPLDTIPEGMPLTNRLDLMTTEQAKWAIRNGTAWIAYLKAQQASAVDVKLLECDRKTLELSDAEKYQAICDVLENVWLGLTDNMQHALKVEQIPDWFDTLQWAIKAIPVGYEKQCDIIQYELREYQPKMTKPKNAAAS